MESSGGTTIGNAIARRIELSANHIAQPNSPGSNPANGRPKARTKDIVFVCLAVGPVAILFFWRFPPFWIRDIVILSPLLAVLLLIVQAKTGGWLGRAAYQPVYLVMFCGPLLVAKGLFDLHVLDGLTGLAVAAMATVIVCWLFRRRIKNLSERQGKTFTSSQWVGIFITIYIYVTPYIYGVFTLIDEQFDTRSAQIFKTQVTAKRITYVGKQAEYLVTVQSWGPVSNQSEYAVPYRSFGSIETGKSACISLHGGFLAARWFDIGPCTGTGAPSSS
jgi:hypothetical protein